MNAIRSVCVYCGSRKGSDPAHAAVARSLGAALARAGVRVVFGGGRIGLMGVVADAALAAGGEVVGVIPERLHAVEIGHDGATELHVVRGMHERKRRMFELSDGFVILPGGLGTLDEAFEIVTWRQLGLHDQPIVLLDSNGYWEPLRALLRGLIGGGFADSSIQDLFTVVSGVDEVLPALRQAPERAAPAPAELL